MCQSGVFTLTYLCSIHLVIRKVRHEMALNLTRLNVLVIIIHLTALVVQVSLCFRNAVSNDAVIPACFYVYVSFYKEWKGSDITAVQFLILLDFHIFF